MGRVHGVCVRLVESPLVNVGFVDDLHLACVGTNSGLRVPCIIRAPGKIPAGATCDAVAATIDLMPMLAKLAGTSAPTDRVIDGVDISQLLHGKKDDYERNYFTINMTV